jgi:4-diphosphocytidyl-2-C-methyl-D-erythritol kinase
MLCFPNCKINIGLHITGRRADGYHDLETVFYPVQVRDALEAVPAAETSLHMSGLPVTGDHTHNLAWKALELLRQHAAGRIPELAIYLHKAIPMGAGLGGGSADGAFMLRLLNDLAGLGLDGAELERLALRLGSDCPFFIRNRPQYATGRGEGMSDISPGLTGYSIQLICPDVHVSTARAFGMITPKAAAFDLRKLPGLAPEEWKDRVTNDFEAPVFAMHPVLQRIKQQLYEQGAVYASMSGSGSAIYGVFRKGERAVVAAEVGFKEFYAEVV